MRRVGNVGAIQFSESKQRITAKLKKILIYEPSISGHHFEFLAYLIRYALRSGFSRNIAIVVHEEFPHHYGSYFPIEDLQARNFLRFETLTKADSELFFRGLFGYFKLYRRIQLCASEMGVDIIHFDSFNILQLFTVFPSKRKPRITCIYYGPFTRELDDGEGVSSRSKEH